jgi:hypothetical protein
MFYIDGLKFYYGAILPVKFKIIFHYCPVKSL